MYMVVRYIALLLTVLLSTVPAHSQFNSQGWGFSTPTAASVSYSGPGDVVSGAKFWYGVRAYSLAAATSQIAAINVSRVTDSHTCDIKLATSGNLGLTANCSTGADNGQSPTSFAGTDATCTGSISTTTLSISSCSSGTLHLGDQISGAGITNPQWITAIGTCASPPGTCTVNNSMSISSETITAAAALNVIDLYDQSGSNSCEVSSTPPAVPCNTSINSGTHSWVLLANCIGSKYCLGNPVSNTIGFGTAIFTTGLALTSSIAEPMTISFVAERTTFVSSTYGGISQSTAGTSDPWFGLNNSANNAMIFAASQVTATANDGEFHAIQELLNNGANLTIFNVDGTETTTNAGAGSFAGSLDIGVLPSSGSGNSGFPGYLLEVGGWASGLTSAQRKSMCENQQSNWGTANFPGGTC